MSIFRDRFLIIIVVVTMIIILGMAVLHLRARVTTSAPAQSEQQPISKESQPLPSNGPFRITHVIDGDTIVLDNGESVRLIGVDAPEAHHSEVPLQRFAEESTEFLRRLVEGFECTLEYEPNEMRDQYDRLLAYVFIGDMFVNAEIIRRGYGYAYTRFPFRRRAEFVMLERDAREKQYGLWSLSLRDGRITNLVNRYDSLSLEGRKKLDEILDKLIQEYPFEQKETGTMEERR